MNTKIKNNKTDSIKQSYNLATTINRFDIEI